MRRSDLRSAGVRDDDRKIESHASSARRLRDAGVISGFLEPFVGGVAKKFSSSAESGGAFRTQSISIMCSSMCTFSVAAMYDLDEHALMDGGKGP